MLTTILLELAGLICLVVAGAHVNAGVAFLVAGLGLVGKSFELESVARKPRPGRRQ